MTSGGSEAVTVVENTLIRTFIGASVLAVVAACLVTSLGRLELALPILGGAGWGMLNVFLLYRLSAYARPDRPPITARTFVDFTLKFPVLYGGAALFLMGRSQALVLAAAAGFGLVLLTIVLRALGATWFGAPTPTPFKRAWEGTDRAS
jgi:hypothetical protein